MRRRPFLPTFGAAILAASSAAAQTVDIVEQSIAVDLRDETAMTVELELLLEVPANVAAQSYLDVLTPALPVVAASLDASPATAAPHPLYPSQVLRVTFPSSILTGGQATLAVSLQGAPTCGGQYCRWSPTETIFTAPAPGRAFYFSDPFVTNGFTGNLSVRLPEAQTVVGPQSLPTRDNHGDGSETWSYLVGQETELLGFYAGFRDSLQSADPRVAVYYDAATDDEDLVAEAFAAATRVLPVYEGLYGPLPVDEVRLVSVPESFAFGGLGMLGEVFLNEVVFGQHGYLATQGVAHEIAHSWWGNLTSSEDPADRAFLGEALAEYSAWRALGIADGAKTRTAGMRMNAVWYMFRRPEGQDAAILAVSPSSPLYVFVTYHKGALALRALEEQVGTTAMDEALRRFATRGLGGASLEALAEDLLDVDLAPWTADWLARPGYPRLSAAVTSEPGAATVRLALAEDWRLRVPLRLVLEGGETVETAIDLSGAGEVEQRFEVPAAVVAVEVDPEWSMAREIAPALPGDVTLDGRVDGADLIALALQQGRYLPELRRVDGGYDPLYDLARDGVIDAADMQVVLDAVAAPRDP
ncbi:MAG: M1 family aminopeptidase [Polyangiaceae bacterium]